MLASGQYAMINDGMGFSLVPWNPVIGQRLGQRLAATVRGSGVSWEIGRQRGMFMLVRDTSIRACVPGGAMLSIGCRQCP